MPGRKRRVGKDAVRNRTRERKFTEEEPDLRPKTEQELLDHYQRHALRYCRKMHLNFQDSEDVTNTVLSRFHLGRLLKNELCLADETPMVCEGEPEHYICRCLHNETTKLLGSMNRRKAKEWDDNDGMQGEYSITFGAERRLENLEVSAVLSEAIGQLSPLEQQIIVLHHFDQETFEQVASKLTSEQEPLTKNAASKRWQRALIKLRALLPASIELE